MIDLLYVEDNPDDADIFSRLIRKFTKPISYTVLGSGSEAVAYLTGQGPYQDEAGTLPKLVLLDLNLNGLSGVEVVQQARSEERTRYLPIVAFSTSDSPRDIQSAYEAGVNAYVVKPGNYQATADVINKLCDFWLVNNLYPV